MDNERLRDSIRGMIFGQALGDAVGVQAEFKSKSSLRDFVIDYPYTKLTRDLLDVKCDMNDWTDDTDQLVLLLETIVQADGLELTETDAKFFAKRLFEWRYHGFPELGDSSGFGLGGCTCLVTGHPNFQVNPHEVAMEVWNESGNAMAANGAVMRTSVLAALPFGSSTEPEEIADKEFLTFYKSVRNMCMVTHYDPRCIISCWAQCYMCKYAILAHTTDTPIGPDRIAKLLSLLKTIGAELSAVNYRSPAEDSKANIVEFCKFIDMSSNLARLRLDKQPGIGYTYRCVACMFWAYRLVCMAQTAGKKISFRAVIKEVAGEGGDADTNGAVCGAFLGAYLGYSNLPEDWLASLPHKDWLNTKVESLFDKLF